jgi:hypothetical protein
MIYTAFGGLKGCILNHINIGLGWVYGAMGNLFGSAVLPMAMCTCCRDCSAVGAISGL